MSKSTNISRFKDLEWIEQVRHARVFVGGLGSIGSWLGFFLARTNPKILMLVDFDKVEEQNLGGQLYQYRQINIEKAEALHDILKKFSRYRSNAYCMEVTKNTTSAEFTFSCFDNMKARKALFTSWKRVENKNKIFIDGRLGAEYFEVFCVTPENIKKYEEFLFDDSEVPDLPCSAKYTTHTAALCAGFMMSFFTNHLTNIAEKANVREVPFHVRYELSLNMLMEEYKEENELSIS